jgi:hypothetical protein
MQSKPQRPNSGILFKNNRKTEVDTNLPDYTGSINVDGVGEFYLNAWIKQGPKQKFMSLSLKPKEAHQAPSRTVAEDMNDEIPF